MIGLRRKEPLQRADLGHDRLLVDFGGVELGDIGLRDLLLLVVGGEDRRAVLRAAVRPLPVQLRRVVHDREEDLQDLAVADLRRVVFDLDRFRVARGAGRDHVVVGGRLAAAGITGDGIDHACGVLEHALHAPEAAAGQHRGLDAVGGRRVAIAGGGMITASSAAREGATAKAAIASAPMAAAQSDRRLKWRRDMVSSCGLVEGSLGGTRVSQSLRASRCPRYGRRALLRQDTSS